ncbi:MAG: hypothetical protein J3Q66DRAFT_322268 [Benniella sp.]|nr:MAG: hypothetical protein J3Q66DRAFT_322268 [Benniella sp.]
MGWFSRSTVTPSESSQQQDTSSSGGSSLAKEGSPGPSLAKSEAATGAPQETHTQTASSPDTPTFESSSAHASASPSSISEEMTEFNEYKTSDDVFDRFKVSDALNQLMTCSSLGSNIRNYYRYGTYRNCNDKYEHLKFCLSIKTKSSQVAQVMIQKHDAELRAKKRSEANSEDVWTARTHPPEELIDLARQG